MKINLFILSTLLLFACKPEKRCHRTYDIEQAVEIYPVQNSYAIGDTIWLEINVPETFFAEINDGQGSKPSQEITLKDFDFHDCSILLTKLIDSTQNSQAQNSSVGFNFNHVLEKGTIVSVDSEELHFKQSYENNSYHLKIGLIPLVSGRYLLHFNRRANYPGNKNSELNEQDILPDCDHETIGELKFPINKLSNGSYNSNYSIFTQFMNPLLETNLPFIQTQSFSFVVD